MTLVALAGGLCEATASLADDAANATIVALRDAAEHVLASGADASFQRPMSIVSSASSNEVRAQAIATIDRPFQDVVQALANPPHWCAVLVLHINNKACRASSSIGAPRIALKVARRYDQPLEQAYELDFAYRLLASSEHLLSVQLDAATGPLGTSDYVIRLDAIPLGPARTAVRLSYAYRQGTMTGLAMDLYFSTVGRGKVGFTVLSATPGGNVQYIGGVRGLVERNIMRYLLAVEAAAYEAEGVHPDTFERRLVHWFKATERYPRQLHEIDESTYLDLKHQIRLAPAR